MKIGIIGSSGKVAKQISQHAFTFNTSHDIEFVFLSDNPELVSAHILDLKSAEGFMLTPNYCEPRFSITPDYAKLEGSDVIFVCSGKFMDALQKERFRKIDPSGRLAHTFENAPVIKNVARKIREYSPQSTVIIVTNQSDMVSEIARATLNGTQTFGMGGILDESRFRKILASLLNEHLPAYRRLKANDLGAEIVGYHNNDMIVVAESLSLPEYAQEILQRKPHLAHIALDETKAYGRKISKNIDSRHPTMHAGASIGPGAACWATIAALTGQRPPLKASFNSLVNKDQSQRYGICIGLHLSMPIVVDANGLSPAISVANCSFSEKATIANAVERMQENMGMLRRLAAGEMPKVS